MTSPFTRLLSLLRRRWARRLFSVGPDGPVADRIAMLKVAAAVGAGFVVVISIGLALDRGHSPAPEPPRMRTVDGFSVPAPISTPSPEATPAFQPGATRLEMMWRVIFPHAPLRWLWAGVTVLFVVGVGMIGWRAWRARGPKAAKASPRPEPAAPAIRRHDRSDYSQRIAQLAADPATVKYAGLMKAGDYWWDEQIAYDRDPAALVTCEHLRPLERALRRAAIPVRFRGSDRVEAKARVDVAELERRGLLASPATYHEYIATERFGETFPTAEARCAEHVASLVIFIHPEVTAPDAPRFAGYDEPGPPLDQPRVEEMIRRLASLIEAPADKLPTFDRTRDFGEAHLEIDEAYHWVVVERGQEYQRRTTGNLDELLFWAFEGVTHAMASNIAASTHPGRGEFRRALFAAQLRLLAELNPEWSLRQRADLETVLAKHPFTDGGPPGL